MESVPHRMRSSPTASRSLPRTWAASPGPAQHHEPRGPELGVHVGTRADAGVGQARHQPAHAPAGVGLVRPLLAVGIGLVARVVHEERDVRGTGRPPARCRGGRTPPGRRREPARRCPCGRRRSWVPSARTCSRNGMPTGLVVEEPAGRHAPGRHGLGRVPQRVHLPARRPQLVAPRPHRLDLPGPELGCTIVWVSTRPLPA